MEKLTASEFVDFAGVRFRATRPHSFGLVIHPEEESESRDYLHDVLLAEDSRTAFLELIGSEGLVVCKRLQTKATSYRTVRGKSSHGRLSQAEYYHHDGCSQPTKPQVVEIRMPYQPVERQIHTAVAPFPNVVRAMLQALPERLKKSTQLNSDAGTSDVEGGVPAVDYCALFAGAPEGYPPVEEWDRIQGRITRMIRREFDAESSRAYFREVDSMADAYVLPWEMGESRLMANNHVDLAKTMQHRRAYQKPRAANEQNGSLVKRWTAEEA